MSTDLDKINEIWPLKRLHFKLKITFANTGWIIEDGAQKMALAKNLAINKRYTIVVQSL